MIKALKIKKTPIDMHQVDSDLMYLREQQKHINLDSKVAKAVQKKIKFTHHIGTEYAKDSIY